MNILAVWSDKESRWKYYQSSTMNFGSIHSVHAWMRTAKAIQFVLRTFFRIPVLLYVDDMICIQPAQCAAGAKHVIQKVVEAFGLRLAESKSKIGQQVDILGASYDVRDSAKLRVDLKPAKKEKLKSKISGCVRDSLLGRCTKKDLEKTLGSINFLICATRFGVLKSIVYPLYQAVASDKEMNQNEVRQILLNVQEMVASYNGLVMVTELDNSVVLYTDASEPDAFDDFQGAPTLAAVLVCEDCVYYMKQEVPDSILKMLKTKKDKLIHTLEAYAIVMAMSTWRGLMQGRQVVAYCDNASCLFSVHKGFSHDLMLRLPAQWLYSEMARNSSFLTLRWIPSLFNPSDGYTRGDLFHTFKAVLEGFAFTNKLSLVESTPANGDWIALAQRTFALMSYNAMCV
jgi:hypothetical protein